MLQFNFHSNCPFKKSNRKTPEKVYVISLITLDISTKVYNNTVYEYFLNKEIRQNEESGKCN